MQGIDMSAFGDEMQKIAGQARSLDSSWSPKTVGAPRAKMPGAKMPKPPTAPGSLSPKVIKPAAQYGPRQNYSQPNATAPPATNPMQSVVGKLPVPNVVFGVR